MSKLKAHSIYGILPTLIIFFILYLYIICIKYLTHYITYSLSLTLFLFILSFSFYFLKKNYGVTTILFYTGFKLASRPVRISLFFFYYMLMLLISILIEPIFLEIYSLYFLISILLLTMVLLEFIILTSKVSVLFIRITPRLYLDLIDNQIHTKEEIKSYDVDGVLKGDLDIHNINVIKNLFYNQKYHRNYLSEKIESIEYEYREKANYINLKAYNKNDRLIWNENFTYDSSDIDEHLLKFIVEVIMDIENS